MNEIYLLIGEITEAVQYTEDYLAGIVYFYGEESAGAPFAETADPITGIVKESNKFTGERIADLADMSLGRIIGAVKN
ncbi:MAG: hypothetical protein LBP79_07410 [Clostridiales bacterium]|jgi:hypothetical protein|nr:hypothetical protein [Clostridiales bacterium]